MSAIFGIYNFDGKPASPSALAEASDVLAHRGTDDTGIWSDKAVGFGHRMLWTTPESLREKLPKNMCGGNLTITADARIDNRDELIKQLGYQAREDISDSEIILLAYEKWGEDCAERLLGDFAFAIWDENRNHLFCARDHFGIKPFYYYETANCFAFASEIKALFALAAVSLSLNEDAIADYLIGNYENKAKTFYRNILRLPPAHCLTAKRSGVRLRSYYSLNPNCELPLSSNEDYAEGLREIFTEAVRCRMRSALPLGSKLSGGLDSSSIACTARDLLTERGGGLLPTFSLVYDRIKECDERHYINPVLSQGGFEPHFMAGDRHTPLNNLEAISRHTDRPAMGPGHSALWELYKTIKQTGVRVILDGHDGDSAVSHGSKYLDELAQAGRWFALTAEARGIGALSGESTREIIGAYVELYRWRPFLRKYPRFKKIENLRRRVTPQKPSKSWAKTAFATRIALINKDFARRLNLAERYQASRIMSSDLSRTARESHYRLVTDGSQVLVLEEMDAVSSAFGLDSRYPFWDKRLIEYCLALPGNQKCYHGWNRVVMRRAMNKVLPPEVCWRKSKIDFTANFIDGLFYRDWESLKDMLTGNSSINQEFFDKRAMREMYQKIDSRNLSSDDIETRSILRAFWEAASFSTWFHNVAAQKGGDSYVS